MRIFGLLLLVAGSAFAQGRRPTKTGNTPTSMINQQRLRMEWEALPDFKPTKLPDGTEKPPRAPWPFLIYVYQNDSKGSEKLRRNVLLDKRFLLATHAVKAIKLKPSKAVDLPYLAQVRGIRDPTLIVLDRDFKVVGAVKTLKEFTAKKVLPLMTRAADAAYQVKLGRWIGAYIKLLDKGEKLWRQELKVDKLRDKAGRSDPAKAKKIDKEADDLEACLIPAKEELADRMLALDDALVLKPDREEALPTTVGQGRSKRKLTPEELEAIKGYREFARNRDPIVRAAAVEDLGAVDSPVMVATILKAANDMDPRVIDAAGKALGKMRSPESLQAMLVGLDASNAKARTAAVLGFAQNPNKYPPAVPVILKLLQEGNDEIRRAAIEALDNQRDPAAATALVAALDDRVPALRVLAATALGDSKAASAVDALCSKLAAPDWSLRKAAAEALGKIRAKASIDPLITALGKAEGLMMDVCYKALVAVTGQDFKYDAANWRKWWDRWGEGFKIPTDEEIRIAKQKAAEAMKGYYDPRKRKDHTIETLSRKMIFVLDISSSMNDKIVIPPYAPEKVREEYPDRVKWHIAQQELTRILATLDKDVWFNIITFAGKVKTWRKGMVQGTQRTTAIKYVAKLKPIATARTASGGGGRRRPGRTTQSSAGGDEQKTNTYAALMAAFGLHAESVPDWKARTKADTIFLVTDGIPTVGKITDVPKLVGFFTDLNRSRGITIHVITFDKDAMKKLLPLAKKNGGQCILRGWDGSRK